MSNDVRSRQNGAARMMQLIRDFVRDENGGSTVQPETSRTARVTLLCLIVVTAIVAAARVFA